MTNVTTLRVEVPSPFDHLIEWRLSLDGVPAAINATVEVEPGVHVVELRCRGRWPSLAARGRLRCEVDVAAGGARWIRIPLPELHALWRAIRPRLPERTRTMTSAFAPAE